MWHQISGQLPYQLEFPKMPDAASPITADLWYQSPGKLPRKLYWPNMLLYTDPVRQEEYICVYDMVIPQDKFNTNGLAILQPTACEITEELNGMYELILEHPIDDTGKWKQLLELNIIKANGQLFRIYRKQTKLNSDGTRLRIVYARHIFYDLNDKCLSDVRPEEKNGYDFIAWIMAHTVPDDDEEYVSYNFTYDSDITETATAYYQQTTPVAALLGEDNCFLNRFASGELYRDNFYFSINTRREGAREDAFNIKYGVDMLDVEESIDYSDVVTYLRTRDNFGNYFAVSYAGTCLIHHNITRELMFNYEENNFDQLMRDTLTYFGSVCIPKISYVVNFASLKNTEIYKDFIDLQRCEVGDTGKIYCEVLDIETTQKVVKKTVDVLNGNAISIELGSVRGNLTRYDRCFFTNTISTNSASDKATKLLQEELRNTRLKMLSTWGGASEFTWNEVSTYKWEELQ